MTESVKRQVQPSLISVCMCTYKRPQLLDTLKSIDNQILDPQYSIEVIVVDNDAELSGKTIFDAFSPNKIAHTSYHSEPLKNISAARNKSINEANGEYIALIDDDEIADEKWLQNLLKTMQRFEADVVFGWVNTIYPEHTPDWIIKGAIYTEPRFEDGKPSQTGASNCTLIKRSALLENDYQFDLSFGTTGAEDVDLFHRMHRNGLKLVTSHDAFVSEVLADDRMTKQYVIKKAIRIGQCFTRCRYKYMTSSQKLTYIGKNIIKLCMSSVVWLLLTLFKAEKAMFWQKKTCDAYGKLIAIYKKQDVEIYK